MHLYVEANGLHKEMLSTEVRETSTWGVKECPEQFGHKCHRRHVVNIRRWANARKRKTREEFTLLQLMFHQTFSSEALPQREDHLHQEAQDSQVLVLDPLP